MSLQNKVALVTGAASGIGEQCARKLASLGAAVVISMRLTAKGRTEEMAAGFEAGADDYLRKPFDLLELRARLLAGQRIVKLHDELVAENSHRAHSVDD